MSKIFALVTLALIVCVSANAIPEKFVSGGEIVEPFTTPFIVSLQRYERPDWIHFCNGALIRRDWVLTATECAEKNSLAVTAKFDLAEYESGQQRKGVAQVEYSPDGRLALLRLDSNIVVDPRTNNISLPMNGPIAGHTLTMFGWPLKDNNQQKLRRADFVVMSNETCAESLKREVSPQFERCLANVDASNNGVIGTCDGNLGSSVVQQRGRLILVGIVIGTQNTCNSPDQPTAVYANLAQYREWIIEFAGLGHFCRRPM